MVVITHSNLRHPAVGPQNVIFTFPSLTVLVRIAPAGLADWLSRLTASLHCAHIQCCRCPKICDYTSKFSSAGEHAAFYLQTGLRNMR